MKILDLHIDKFRHLENLDFDFTYQTGERKGQILDKICFIGQSATGKTSLLELICEYYTKIANLSAFTNNSLFGEYINGGVSFLINNEVFHLDKGKVFFKNNEYRYNNKNKSGTIDPIISTQEKKDVFYFKANLISDKNIDVFTKNPIDLIEKYSEITTLSLAKIRNKKDNENQFITAFNDDVDTKIWFSLLSEILQYRKNFTQKMSELIHKGLLADTKKLSSEFQKWQKDNPNALEIFAEKLNPILEKLNLEVDLVNTEYSIPIKNKKTNKIIPIQNTSTGTKGLLLSFLPLFKLDTKDSIILIDEPERSLYPDMQMDLMDYYKNLAPEAQFIVATHSPFIAASFEPDERFILYFDKEGKVAVRRGSSPIGDDPNDMLYNDFGINYINKFGQAKYNEYLELKQKIHFEKDEKIKKEYAEKLEKIGEEYNF